MRRAAKVDATQHDIVAGLRGLGYKVQSLASVGDGVPDVLVKTPKGYLRLLEIKSAGGKLTPDQRRWHAAWGGDVDVVWTLDQALFVLEGW